MTALTLAAPAVDLDTAPAPGVGDARCQMEWAWLPGLTWDRCEPPATVDALVHCGGCGTYVRSWCGPCTDDATDTAPDRLVCVTCEQVGALVVAIHPR